MAVGDFFFTPWVLLLITRECHDEFFVDFNFFHVVCLKLLISKGLGIVIIAGSLMVKIPQILKVVKAGSSEGLSFMSFYFELLALTTNFAYNLAKGFPFSTWGESLFISIQSTILILICYHYTRAYASAFIFSAIYSVSIFVLVSGITPVDVLTKLQVGVLPIMIMSKLFQIIENFRNGHTGQLSAITVFLNFAGSLARVFTTFQETGDTILLTNFIVAVTLNAVLFFQILFFWNEHPDEKLKKKQ